MKTAKMPKFKCKGQNITYKVKYGLPHPGMGEPALYQVKQYGTNCKGKGIKGCKVIKTEAVITLDPILKKYSDLRKDVLKHELNEICDWAKGGTAPHIYAREKEPKYLRKLSITGFWKEIKRRERQRKR